MAASPAIPKVSHHFRSISLPSESHQLTLSVEEHLCRLRSSELASSSSSSSICQNLAGLQDLYDSLDDLLQSAAAQKSLSTGDKKCLDRTLDASLKIVDVCGTTRDICSQMKQNLQGLRSNIRRRGAESSSFSSGVRTYMSSRKEGSKCIQKCFSDMKKMDNRSINEDSGIIKILSEVESVTLAVFKSLLTLVNSNPNSWSLVSKLVAASRGGDKDDNEIAKADAAIKALTSHKTKSVHVEDIQETLEALELGLEGVEDGLEFLSRGLIKTRLCLETPKTGERKGIRWTGPLNISSPVIWLQRGKQGMERNPFPTERKGIKSFSHPRPSENLAKEWGDPLLRGERNWWERRGVVRIYCCFDLMKYCALILGDGCQISSGMICLVGLCLLLVSCLRLV